MAEYPDPRPSSQPEGSTAMVVAKDNLITLDKIAVSTDLTVTTRKGQERKTWAGMDAGFTDIIDQGEQGIATAIAAAGYQIAGDFADSIVPITDANQVLTSKSVVGFEDYVWRTNQPLPYTRAGSDPTQAPEAGKWLAVSIGELETVARGLNVLDSDVIYSTDTVTPIPAYIYSASQQKTYSVPADAIGKTIVSVVGSTLNTVEVGGPYRLTVTRPVTSYAEFIAQLTSLEYIDIAGARFERSPSNDGGSSPAVVIGSLYIFNASGHAYRYASNEWEINTNSIGSDNVQIAIDYMTSRPFGGRVVHVENTNISGFLNVLPNVELIGAGASESSANEIKIIDTADANKVCVFIKEGAAIRNIKICGSGYVRQSGGADFIGYNKIGITTQGASVNKLQAKIENVGFSQILNSAVLVFDNHHDVTVSGCYSYGNMPGAYVETDGSELVSDWNVAPDPVKLAAGTQVYALTNFYNSGQNTHNVTLKDNKGLVNFNDSAFAVNGTAYGHKIYGNESKKNDDGYYGGFGLDFNGGSNNKAWGNTLDGHGIGAHVHSGAKDNVIYGNTFKAPNGILYTNGAQSNHDYGNEIRLGIYGAGIKQDIFYRGYGVASRGLNTVRNQSSSQVKPSATSTTSLSGSIVSVEAGTFSRTKVTTSTNHGIGTGALIEISGVSGVDCNGLWTVAYVSETEIELIASTFAGAYSSGGAWLSAVAGVAALRDQGNSLVAISTSAYRVEDINTGIWVSEGSGSSVIDFGIGFSNVPVPYRGKGALGNNITNMTGLSVSGKACRNRNGGVVVLASTTETAVTFSQEEDDTNYRVTGLISSSANIGAFLLSKSTTGFIIGHETQGVAREVDWTIER